MDGGLAARVVLEAFCKVFQACARQEDESTTSELRLLPQITHLPPWSQPVDADSVGVDVVEREVGGDDLQRFAARFGQQEDVEGGRPVGVVLFKPFQLAVDLLRCCRTLRQLRARAAAILSVLRQGEHAIVEIGDVADLPVERLVIERAVEEVDALWGDPSASEIGVALLDDEPAVAVLRHEDGDARSPSCFASSVPFVFFGEESLRRSRQAVLERDGGLLSDRQSESIDELSLHLLVVGKDEQGFPRSVGGGGDGQALGCEDGEKAYAQIREEQARTEQAHTEEASSEIAFLASLAKQHEIWLHAGSLVFCHDSPHHESSRGKLVNRSLLFSPEGAEVARYDKIHLFDVDLEGGESYRESARYEAGKKAVLAATPWGKLGMSVCYDLRFPRLYRHLAERGAIFFAVPSAFTVSTGRAHWQCLLRARAIENACFVFAAAQTGLLEDGRRCWGHSMIVSPWGEILVEAGGGGGGCCCGDRACADRGGACENPCACIGERFLAL